MYAFALYNESKEDNVLADIDQFLTADKTPLGMTIKLFIIKQMLNMCKPMPDNIHDIYEYR
ncbi:unnamed protein product, partial [Rotaria socialis]